MSECESTRGKWGGICPDCGERLPSIPKPLESWMAQRARLEGEALRIAALKGRQVRGSRRAA